MEIEIGIGKSGRRAYGFDDIAIVPSRRTRDPDDIDITWTLGPYRFELPLLASAMDGVVSPRTAGIVGSLGGLAVLNLEGIFTRYEDAEDQLDSAWLQDTVTLDRWTLTGGVRSPLMPAFVTPVIVVVAVWGWGRPARIMPRLPHLLNQIQQAPSRPVPGFSSRSFPSLRQPAGE